MTQQILIIGLGQFGMSLAKTLSQKNTEVLAVDPKKALVEEASAFVTQAVVMDATDEAELSKLNPAKRDAVVCAIGDDSKESSIICTALLKQMGTPYIVARANDKLHQRILQLVGAHQIVNPEQEFGKRFANKLLYKSAIADASITDDLNLTEVKTQPYMVGKNLIELELPKRFGVTVVGVRNGTTGSVLQPLPNQKLKESDSLVIVSSESAIPKLIKG